MPISITAACSKEKSEALYSDFCIIDKDDANNRLWCHKLVIAGNEELAKMLRIVERAEFYADQFGIICLMVQDLYDEYAVGEFLSKNNFSNDEIQTLWHWSEIMNNGKLQVALYNALDTLEKCLAFSKTLAMIDETRLRKVCLHECGWKEYKHAIGELYWHINSTLWEKRDQIASSDLPATLFVHVRMYLMIMHEKPTLKQLIDAYDNGIHSYHYVIKDHKNRETPNDHKFWRDLFILYLINEKLKACSPDQQKELLTRFHKDSALIECYHLFINSHNPIVQELKMRCRDMSEYVVVKTAKLVKFDPSAPFDYTQYCNDYFWNSGIDCGMDFIQNIEVKFNKLIKISWTVKRMIVYDDLTCKLRAPLDIKYNQDLRIIEPASVYVNDSKFYIEYGYKGRVIDIKNEKAQHEQGVKIAILKNKPLYYLYKSSSQ